MAIKPTAAAKGRGRQGSSGAMEVESKAKATKVAKSIGTAKAKREAAVAQVYYLFHYSTIYFFIFYDTMT